MDTVCPFERLTGNSVESPGRSDGLSSIWVGRGPIRSSELWRMFSSECRLLSGRRLVASLPWARNLQSMSTLACAH